LKKAIRRAPLALGFVAASALAQSNVTIAGRVDVSGSEIDNGATKQKRVDSGTYTASRLIFRGREDLGSGLYAVFYLEHRFNADTGTQNSAAKFYNGGSFVGIGSNTLGQITMGRQYVPMFWPMLWGDESGQFRLHNFSATQSIERGSLARIAVAASPIKAAGALDSVGSGVYALNISNGFEDNQIIYRSPVVLGGASAMLSVGAPEGYAAGTGKVFGANAEYRKGEFYAGVALNDKRSTIPAGGGAEQRVQEQVVSALYEVLPGFKVWGNLHPWQFKSNGTPLKGNDFMVGTSYWWGTSMVWLNYGSKRIDDCNRCGSQGLGIGYHYLFSKRTEFYASYAKIRNEANAANGLAGFTPSAPGQDMGGIAAGIAVTF